MSTEIEFSDLIYEYFYNQDVKTTKPLQFANWFISKIKNENYLSLSEEEFIEICIKILNNSGMSLTDVLKLTDSKKVLSKLISKIDNIEQIIEQNPAILKVLNKNDIVKMKNVLMKIGSNPLNGEYQYLALEILSEFPNDPDIKKFFINLAYDWDTQVRRLVLKAFSNMELDETVIRILRNLRLDESDEENIKMIDEILKKI
jgi:hypothetical protein